MANYAISSQDGFSKREINDNLQLLLSEKLEVESKEY